MKDLYIFVTTDRPDPYLNPILHCIIRGTTRIVFVQIEDSKIDQVQLNLLRANVYDLIKNLSLGFYKYYTGNHKDTLFALDTVYSSSELARLKAQYIPCLTDNIKWDIERIKYLELRKYISSLNKKSDRKIIFDVTSVTKVYIGDILACCLLEDVRELRTFEFLIIPNYEKPWKMLIHELEESKQYRHLNLVETPIFKEGANTILIRTTPLLISIIGTVIFVALALVTTFVLGNNSAVTQAISSVGTALGIISFFLIYFPIRGK